MTEITHVLADGVNELLKRRSAMTLNGLAKMTGIGYPTLRRISLREGKPSAETVITLAPFLFKGEELAGVLSQIGINDVPSKGREVLWDDERPNIRDKTDLLIMGLLCRDSGASKSEIQKRFGDLGTQRLQDFVSSEFAKQDGEVYRFIDGKLFLVGQEYAFKAINYCLDLMRETPPESQAYSQGIFAVNEDGLKRMVAAHTSCVQAMKEAVETYPGNIVVIKGTFIANLSTDAEEVE